MRTRSSDVQTTADAMLVAIRSVARRMPKFTTDDIWRHLAAHNLSAFTAIGDRRRLGGLMLSAERLGLCKPIEEWRTSTSSVCHSRPKRVWVSLL